MADGQVGYKRRTLIVSGLQYRLTAVSFLYLLVIVLTIAVTVGGPLVGQVDDESRTFAERANAARNLLGVYAATWIALPIAVLLCLAHAVLVSHRIAGPLYRFKQSFRELAGGNLGLVVRIRRADYLAPETDAINRMIEELADKVQHIRTRHAATSRTLPELARALERNDVREAAVLCGKLGTELDALGRAIHVFRVPAVAEDDPVRTPAPVPARV
jgi:methyl-accepting chemotaxis protein